jgi:hypothetical protein
MVSNDKIRRSLLRFRIQSEWAPTAILMSFEARCPGAHLRSLQRDLASLLGKSLLEAEGAINRMVYRASGAS